MTDKTKLAAARDDIELIRDELKAVDVHCGRDTSFELEALDRLSQAIGEDTDAPTCQHENTSTGYDHIDCRDCGAFKTDGQWGIASRRWFKNKAEAEFYKEHGRYPEAHPPAVDWIEGLRKPVPNHPEREMDINEYDEYQHNLTWNAALDAVKEGMK